MGALLDRFRTAGVRFEAEAGDRLRAHGALTDELRAVIRAHKPAILAELAAANDEAHWRWWITPPNRSALEVRVRPDVTAEQVRQHYPGATVEPLPDDDS